MTQSYEEPPGVASNKIFKKALPSHPTNWLHHFKTKHHEHMSISNSKHYTNRESRTQHPANRMLSIFMKSQQLKMRNSNRSTHPQKQQILSQIISTDNCTLQPSPTLKKQNAPTPSIEIMRSVYFDFMNKQVQHTNSSQNNPSKNRANSSIKNYHQFGNNTGGTYQRAVSARRIDLSFKNIEPLVVAGTQEDSRYNALTPSVTQIRSKTRVNSLKPAPKNPLRCQNPASSRLRDRIKEKSKLQYAFSQKLQPWATIQYQF